MTKINLTPIIDVVFILLIFFMLATNFQKFSKTDINLSSETASISQRPVNLSGSKTYDASTAANSSGLSLSNLVSSETLILSGSGILGSPAAGNQTIVNTDTLSLSDGSGTASNYTLTNGSLTMTVLPRDVNVAGSKPYDGTTTVNPSDLINFNNLLFSISLIIFSE